MRPTALMSKLSNDGMRSSLSASTASTVSLTGSDADDLSHRQSLMVASRWPSETTLVTSPFGTEWPRPNTKPDQSAVGVLLSLAKDEGPKVTLPILPYPLPRAFA